LIISIDYWADLGWRVFLKRVPNYTFLYNTSIFLYQYFQNKNSQLQKLAIFKSFPLFLALQMRRHFIQYETINNLIYPSITDCTLYKSAPAFRRFMRGTAGCTLYKSALASEEDKRGPAGLARVFKTRAQLHCPLQLIPFFFLYLQNKNGQLYKKLATFKFSPQSLALQMRRRFIQYETINNLTCPSITDCTLYNNTNYFKTKK
jgi:hypothetical protein